MVLLTAAAFRPAGKGNCCGSPKSLAFVSGGFMIIFVVFQIAAFSLVVAMCNEDKKNYGG